MKQLTNYRITKREIYENLKMQTEFGLYIKDREDCVQIDCISSDRQHVKDIVRKLKPFNLSPCIAKEVIEDLLY